MGLGSYCKMHILRLCWPVHAAMAAIFLGTPLSAQDSPGETGACAGPDAGEAATVATAPANKSVNVFHYRAGALGSVIEFCVRETGGAWTLVASHGADQGRWSLLQSWIYPKTVEIKTSAYANGTLRPLALTERSRTSYGYSFSWSEGSQGQDDRVVYCYGGLAGCPTSGRGDYP